MIRRLLHERARRRALQRVRREMSALGMDVGHLSDEQLERRVNAMAKMFRGSGMTFLQAQRRITLACEAFSRNTAKHLPR